MVRRELPALLDALHAPAHRDEQYMPLPRFTFEAIGVKDLPQCRQGLGSTPWRSDRAFAARQTSHRHLCFTYPVNPWRMSVMLLKKGTNVASALYSNYRNLLLGGGSHTLPDLNEDTIMVALRDEGTTAVDLATHQDLADISAAVVDAEQVGSPTVGVVGAGVFDHADVT